MGLHYHYYHYHHHYHSCQYLLINGMENGLSIFFRITSLVGTHTLTLTRFRWVRNGKPPSHGQQNGERESL